MQPFTVGTCLSEAFDALLRSWRMLLLVVGLSAPLWMTAALALQEPATVDRHAVMLILIPGFDMWLATLVTAAVVATHYDRDVSIGRLLLAMVRRFLPVYFTMALIYLVVLAIGFGCSLPFASREAWSSGLPPSALLAFGAWMLVSALLYTRWFVAVPAAVVETWNPLKALRRSDRLTRGHRGPLFSILALIGVLCIGTLAVLEVRLGDRRDIDAILFAVTMIGAIPVIVVRAAVSATAYVQLRGATEAGDPAQLGRVFE